MFAVRITQRTNGRQGPFSQQGDVLDSLGFDVMLHIDVDRREMDRAIRDFGRELTAKRGVGLTRGVGHGSWRRCGRR